MEMLKRVTCLVAISALVYLSACATEPGDISARYVSDLQYQNFDCNQIAAETARVQRRVNNLYASLEDEAGADEAQMAVGLILFWPALFFLEGGDGPEAAEYAQLKGEAEALERVAIAKRCASSGSASTSDSDTRSVEARLRELKQLRDNDLINDKEYQSLKSKLLSDL
jgi:hypothetical protein